jgi:hypothetical protein
MRYILHGGYVVSPLDGGEYWISARRLRQLYSISRYESVVYVDQPEDMEGRTFSADDIHLYPSSKGNYLLPR